MSFVGLLPRLLPWPSHGHAHPKPHAPDEVQLSPFKVAWNGSLIASLALAPAFIDIGAIAFSGASAAFILCFGHSAGFHRGVIHRAYTMHTNTARGLAYLAALAGIGGPLGMLRMHNTRDSHQNTEACPDYYTFAHSAVRDATWYLFHTHVGPSAPIDSTWERDPVFNWIERTWVWHHLLIAVALGVLGGPAWMIWGAGVRSAVCVLGHWYVNYAAHTRGYRNYRMPGSGEEGRNHLLWGAFAMGEGWHNNHHAWPDSARFGMRAWELDPGWWAVCVMRTLGLVWAVKTPEDGATLRSTAVREF